jgi:hypothetical protein
VTQVDVMVDPGSMERTQTGAVAGTLWLRCRDPRTDEQQLPETGWSDFPVPVLTWWLQALAQLASGHASELRFMDGPLVVKIEPRPVDRLAVLTSTLDLELSAAEFENCVRGAATSVLDECNRRNWSSRDILQLQREVRRPAFFRAG